MGEYGPFQSHQIKVYAGSRVTWKKTYKDMQRLMLAAIVSFVYRVS